MWTELGPPERMITQGFKAAIAWRGEVPEMQTVKMESWRIRRVMRWVYWEPKSRMRTGFSPPEADMSDKIEFAIAG